VTVSEVASSSFVDAARSLRPLIEAHADEAEQLRRLPAPTLAALVDAGLMRLCVPAAYGGPDVDPMTLVEAIEAVAVADGSAGWCTMIGATTSSLSMFLPPETARELYGDPTIVTGGVFAPMGVGAVEDGAVRVTGRWQWGSGTQHCRWIVGGTRCDDDVFRLVFFDAADVTFHDTWYVSGLQGTGSLDFSVAGAVVPLERTLVAVGGRRTIESPAAAFPNLTLLASAVAAVSLGIGRRALDELVALAAGKVPQFASKTLALSSFTQIELSKAEALLRSARAFLLDEIAAAWDQAVRTGHVDLDARIRIRIACANAAEQAVNAADVAYTLGGGSSVFRSNPLQRCLRDAHMATQHVQVAPKLHEAFGRYLLGVEVDTTMM
jgi:indole-3-acetate monooxygenase